MNPNLVHSFSFSHSFWEDTHLLLASPADQNKRDTQIKYAWVFEQYHLFPSWSATRRRSLGCCGFVVGSDAAASSATSSISSSIFIIIIKSRRVNELSSSNPHAAVTDKLRRAFFAGRLLRRSPPYFHFIRQLFPLRRLHRKISPSIHQSPFPSPQSAPRQRHPLNDEHHYHYHRNNTTL